MKRHPVHGATCGWLIASILILALAAAPLAAFAATAAEQLQRTSIYAYYSVVKDKPYAPYTAAQQLQQTSIYAYYSVIRDKPYAPYTPAEQLKRTSIYAYYSVLH